MAVFAATLTLAACGGPPEFRYAKGRSIEIHAGNPVTTDKVAFSDGEGKHRVIRPRASNRQLAVVEVTVVNRTSTVMPLLIDPDAAQLGDRRGERIFALDPFESSSFADSADVDEDKFAPLLWGEVSLERQFQLQGWMIFDVPKGLTLGSLWWSEIDDVVLDYVDYFRRRG